MKGFFSGEADFDAHCKPTDQMVYALTNDDIGFEERFLDYTYSSGGLTGAVFSCFEDSAAYNLVLMQELRNEDGSIIAGDGKTEYTFLNGCELVSQTFSFRPLLDGIFME
ncbi:MAG: hypothetical protein GX352_02750 [Clostridiales bacterium]|nr:hypothetical protein [Clostridiales bacterium]